MNNKDQYIKPTYTTGKGKPVKQINITMSIEGLAKLNKLRNFDPNIELTKSQYIENLITKEHDIAFGEETETEEIKQNRVESEVSSSFLS